jgi:quinol monooxygenase YgiN
MNVILLVRFSGKKGRGKKLTQLIQPLPPKNDIDGCLGFEVFANPNNPDDVLILERWETVQAHKKFLAGLLEAGALDEVLEHVEAVERTYFVEVKE